MKAWIAIALMVASSAAGAQTLYKCVVSGKPTSYQSHPCENQRSTVKTWAAQPEAEPTNSELWRQYYAKKRGEADSRYLSNLAGRSRGAASQGAAMRSATNSAGNCQSMKSMRDAAVNNDTGYAARRQWADQVYDACK